MPRSKSSRRWLDRQMADPYVKRAQQDGYRSRAAYKLLEILEKDRILAPGFQVADLGAAPGSWSQVARDRVGTGGRVIGLDLLPMDPLPGVTFLLGDFREPEVLAQLEQAVGETALDTVLSDMAPNISGTNVVDQARAIYLVELALDFARARLKPGGSLAVKMFQGEGFDEYLRELRTSFERVVSRKPKASRAESREIYLVAKGFHP